MTGSPGNTPTRTRAASSRVIGADRYAALERQHRMGPEPHHREAAAARGAAVSTRPSIEGNAEPATVKGNHWVMRAKIMMQQVHGRLMGTYPQPSPAGNVQAVQRGPGVLRPTPVAATVAAAAGRTSSPRSGTFVADPDTSAPARSAGAKKATPQVPPKRPGVELADAGTAKVATAMAQPPASPETLRVEVSALWETPPGIPLRDPPAARPHRDFVPTIELKQDQLIVGTWSKLNAAAERALTVEVEFSTSKPQSASEQRLHAWIGQGERATLPERAPKANKVAKNGGIDMGTE